MDQQAPLGSASLKLIAPSVVADRTSLSWRTIQRKVRSEADFPKPRSLGARIAFVEAEVEAWIMSRPLSRAA